MALALARGFDRFMADTKQGQWRRENSARMQTLTGKTMLVVGLGGIGTEVASRAHGLGMKVVATRNSGRTGPDYVSYVGLPDELPTLAKDADVIVNTAPLTKETTGLFNAKFFASLKSTRVLHQHCARRQRGDGGSAEGAGRRAASLAPGSTWSTPSRCRRITRCGRRRTCIITPHVSSRSDLPGEQRWVLAREDLRRYLAGGRRCFEVTSTDYWKKASLTISSRPCIVAAGKTRSFCRLLAVSRRASPGRTHQPSRYCQPVASCVRHHHRPNRCCYSD